MIIYARSRRSCLLFSLLPASARAASATAASSTSLPVVVFAVALVAVVSEGIACAEGQGSGCEAVGEVDLCADGVGEIRDYEDVLNMCVAASR